MRFNSTYDDTGFNEYESSVHNIPPFNETALNYLMQYLEDVVVITSELTPLICQDVCMDFVGQMAEIFGPDAATWPFALERLLSPTNLLPQVIDKNTMALHAELQKLRDKATKVLTDTLFSRLLHVTDLIRVIDATLVRHYEAALLSHKLR